VWLGCVTLDVDWELLTDRGPGVTGTAGHSRPMRYLGCAPVRSPPNGRGALGLEEHGASYGGHSRHRGPSGDAEHQGQGRPRGNQSAQNREDAAGRGVIYSPSSLSSMKARMYAGSSPLTKTTSLTSSSFISE